MAQKNRKEKKKIEKIDSSFNQNWQGIVKVILFVLCFLGIFFLLTVYITNKHSNDSNAAEDNSSTGTTIQYDKILAGSSFNMSEDEYLVIYYDYTDEDLVSDMSTAISEYKSKDDSFRVYTVDLGSALNKHLVGTESNSTPNDASEFSFTGPTLIKFHDAHVEEYVEGVDSILEYIS